MLFFSKLLDSNIPVPPDRCYGFRENICIQPKHLHIRASLKALYENLSLEVDTKTEERKEKFHFA